MKAQAQYGHTVYSIYPPRSSLPFYIHPTPPNTTADWLRKRKEDHRAWQIKRKKEIEGERRDKEAIRLKLERYAREQPARWRQQR